MDKRLNLSNKLAKRSRVVPVKRYWQQLADYIRTVEQDLEVLDCFNQLAGLQLNSWTEAKQYLTSKAYFEENLAKIEQRFSEKLK
ncbi:Uncharacterised protein [Actinobacillus pleuropneumoniae]|nr:Uncharacterised protein [Actinobacillus pleuropneumoniae]